MLAPCVVRRLSVLNPPPVQPCPYWAEQAPRRGRWFNSYSTSVNWSSRLRWIIEKLSSETSVSTVSPSAVT